MQQKIQSFLASNAMPIQSAEQIVNHKALFFFFKNFWCKTLFSLHQQNCSIRCRLSVEVDHKTHIPIYNVRVPEACSNQVYPKVKQGREKGIASMRNSHMPTQIEIGLFRASQLHQLQINLLKLFQLMNSVIASQIQYLIPFTSSIIYQSNSNIFNLTLTFHLRTIYLLF